eukprot:TRINITY_DN1294_c0_g1_i1.p1 TRINITY_DN1294_c0_g1~~TRINITY_DN1294_c0_g1_i1.p1  ORF type:complete len:311 (+),score=73.90 TRINITY_DN1294_c0_g1_i1:296-1228(+)
MSTDNSTGSENGSSMGCAASTIDLHPIKEPEKKELAVPSSSSSSSEDSSEESKGKKYTSISALGVAQDRNARFRRTMEDEHISIDGFGGVSSQGYFAIYDGHGGRGAVEFTVKTLHKNLETELQKENVNPIEALRAAYLKTDEQLGVSQAQYSGTTSVSALIRVEGGEKYLYTANAGDARAVLARAEGKAHRLTYDHKGSDESETKRIVDAGGFVALNRVNGVLAVTRSLGDHAMKDYVIADPYTQTNKLDAGDTHLILACDGLWDVASDQEAVDLILDEPDAQKAAEKLLIHALKNGSTDNISIMTIYL